MEIPTQQQAKGQEGAKRPHKVTAGILGLYGSPRVAPDNAAVDVGVVGAILPAPAPGRACASSRQAEASGQGLVRQRQRKRQQVREVASGGGSHGLQTGPTTQQMQGDGSCARRRPNILNHSSMREEARRKRSEREHVRGDTDTAHKRDQIARKYREREREKRGKEQYAYSARNVRRSRTL
jgi:hypothetical protein